MNKTVLNQLVTRRVFLKATAAGSLGLAFSNLQLNGLTTACAQPSFKPIRIHAIITTNTDGSESSLVNHPDAMTHDPALKYRIEPADITKLVEGANASFAAAGIKFIFDPKSDVEVENDTLLNKDNVQPHHSISSSDSEEIQNIVYRGSDRNIYKLWAGSTWQQQNLTAAAQAPLAAGSPFAYVTDATGIQHVIYRSTDGHIQELFGNTTWQYNTLTIQANAPRAAGDPAGYATFDSVTERMDIQHVVYRGVDNHIHELFAGDTWKHNILTVQSNAPQAAGNPFGYVTYDLNTGRLDVQHVVYRGKDRHIHELFAGDVWQYNTLTIQARAPKASGNPYAYTTDYTNVQHVIYRGVDGHIHELFAGDTWKHNTLTSLTNAAKASGDPVGYTTNDYNFGLEGDQHVVYRGIDGHIHELYTVEEWRHNILTQQTNAPTAASGLTAYTNGAANEQHVVYVDNNGNIHELFSGEKWAHNNLSAAVSAKQASGNIFGYIVGEKVDKSANIKRNQVAKIYRGQLVVYFRYGWGGWSSSVDEFVVMPSVWNPNDLTFLAHEIGHNFHLGHTFSPVGSVAEATNAIQKYVEGLAKGKNNGQLPPMIPADLIARGYEAIDGDYPYVKDTPAELAGGMFADLCNPGDATVEITVTFSTGQKQTYTFKPDLDNQMNYVPKCRGKPAHFSNGQLARMRNALENGNRSHLIDG